MKCAGVSVIAVYRRRYAGALPRCYCLILNRERRWLPQVIYFQRLDVRRFPFVKLTDEASAITIQK